MSVDGKVKDSCKLNLEDDFVCDFKNQILKLLLNNKFAKWWKVMYHTYVYETTNYSNRSLCLAFF